VATVVRAGLISGAIAVALCTAGWLGAEGPEPESVQLQVNTYTAESQNLPSVVANVDGDFVIVWHSYGSSGTDTSGCSIQGQRYSEGQIFADGFESGDTSGLSSTVQ